jgi:hypothetical protein
MAAVMHAMASYIAGLIVAERAQPADDLLSALAEAFRGLLARLPGLRLAVDASELRFKEKMTITSVVELPVTWEA